jgi:TRAP-type mannitol/chloroaromatic compound transport system permease small subunit
MNQYHIKKDYIIHDTRLRRKIKVELLSAPLFLIIPVSASLFLFYDWFTRGFMNNNPMYDGELILGSMILIGNMITGVPFIKSMGLLRKEMKKRG